MMFFVGLHQPSDCQHFARSFVSVNRLRQRKAPFAVNDWIMDSGAFTEVAVHGGYRSSVQDYATEINRWSENGAMLAAVAQDWMCEPFVLAKTGMTVADHQRLTVERYDELMGEAPAAYIMPVLQGYEPHEYARHVREYGDRLSFGAWVGVGSVCKRNASPESIACVLAAVKDERPDLRLHGFGLKLTALTWESVSAQLHSADSMAWSFAARRGGRNANDWREAEQYRQTVEDRKGTVKCGFQPMLPLLSA
jgi:hypothetical protein